MDIFGRIFGSSGSSKSNKRQNTAATATATSSATEQPQRQRRNTLTDTHTVAQAFNSGDPEQISDLMKRHVVRVTNAQATSNDVHTFGVTEHPYERTRQDSSGNLHQMKTFNLSPNPKNKSIPTIEATYFPMTPKQTAWDGTPGDKDLQTGNIVYTRQKSTVAATTPLSGCGVAEDKDGNLAHVQPYGTGTSNSKLSGQQEASLVRQTTLAATDKLGDAHGDVFGPPDYGRYDTQGGQVARTTNVFVVNDKSGTRHAIGQTVYGDGGNEHIKTFSRPFGPRYEINSSHHGPTAPLGSGTPPPQSEHHLSAPQTRQPPMKDSLPPPARRHSISTQSSNVQSNSVQTSTATVTTSRTRANSLPT